MIGIGETVCVQRSGSARAPRAVFGAPPNTRSGRRGRRPVQPRRLRSPTLNRYPIRWERARVRAPSFRNGLAFLAPLPPFFSVSFDRQPGAAYGLPGPAPRLVCQSAEPIFTEIKFAL